MKIESFKQLDIWKEAISIAEIVYLLTNSVVFNKDFGLRDQIRRAAVSISANIAEGFGRSSKKEFRRFLKISNASLTELRSHLYICLKIEYIKENEYENIDKKLEILSKKIGSLTRYLKLPKTT